MAFGSSDLTLIIKAKDQASMTLEKIRGHVNRNAATYEKAGKRMLIASAALTAGLGVAIVKAAGFQQQMAQVATMLDSQSKKYLPGFEKAIKTMSLEFGEGTDTLATGLYNILSASIPAEKAISVLDASVKAAKAGLTDTGTAADAITTIINAYGLSAEKATDVSDLLFTIVKRGKLTFAELAPNIGKVAAMAAKTGLSLEDLGATIATLTRSGVRTEMAMTAVRGILNGMLKPADAAAKAFKDKLGVAMNTTTLRAEGLVGILRRMKKAGLTPEEISKMFPNVRALVGVVAAMGDLEGITKDYNLMVNRAGAAQEAYEINIATTQVTLLRLKAAFNLLAVEIGKHLLPIVDKISNVMIKMVGQYSDLEEGTKKITSKTIMYTAAALGLGGAFLLIVGKIPAMVAGFQMTSRALIALKTHTLLVSTATRATLAGAFVFAGYKLTELVLKVREYIGALKEQKEASMTAAQLEQEAFSKLIWKFGELRGKFSELGSEYVKQIELIDNLRDQYEKIGETTEYNAEATLNAQRRITQEIIELMSIERKRLIQKREIAEEEKIINDEKLANVVEYTDAEKALYQRLNGELRKFSLSEIKDQRKKLMEEKGDRRLAITTEITDKTKQKRYLLKLDEIYVKKSAALDNNLAMQKRTNAFAIAGTAIEAMILSLDAEGSSAEKKKKLMIGLLLLEKSLAIAKVWTAHAGIPFVGIPMAIAQTALIVAQFAVLMKGMRGAGGDITSIPPITVPQIGEGDFGDVDEAERGIIDGGGTVVDGGGGGATVVRAGAVSRVTHIDVGGVEVNLGGINVREENLEEILRDIGEAVKSKTVEAVTMAMRIYNTGKELEEEAV